MCIRDRVDCAIGRDCSCDLAVGGVPLVFGPYVSGGGQVVATAGGGAHRPVKRVVHAVSQGHAVGRCSVRRRAEDAIRAGTCTSLRRIVAVVALAIEVPARVAAARVRLNAMTARTSQAAFAVNFPDGRWARAEFFRSAWTCSMIAWPRWVLSAATVSVKKPWNRQVWNRVACPGWALRCSRRLEAH